MSKQAAKAKEEAEQSFKPRERTPDKTYSLEWRHILDRQEQERERRLLAQRSARLSKGRDCA